MNGYEIALPVRNEYYLPVLMCSPSAYDKGCITTDVCIYALYAGWESRFMLSESARTSVGYYAPTAAKAFGEFLTKRLRTCSEYADRYGSPRALARVPSSFYGRNVAEMEGVAGARTITGDLNGARKLLHQALQILEEGRPYWHEGHQLLLDRGTWLADAIDRSPESIPAKLRRWRDETAKVMGYQALLKAFLQSAHSRPTV